MKKNIMPRIVSALAGVLLAATLLHAGQQFEVQVTNAPVFVPTTNEVVVTNHVRGTRKMLSPRFNIPPRSFTNADALILMAQISSLTNLDGTKVVTNNISPTNWLTINIDAGFSPTNGKYILTTRAYLR